MEPRDLRRTCQRLAVVLSLALMSIALLSPINTLSTRAQAAAVPVDVTISLYSSPAGEARAAYDRIIQYFADAVYEMSNTADKVRRVEIYSGGDYANRANIKWVEECHPCANVSGYGREGMSIVMCDRFGSEQNYLADDNLARVGGYGSLGHEWGHYFYGLFDEYQGEGTACSADDPGQPCQSDISVDKSLMNTGDFAALTGDLGWLNFSTSLNETKNNAQYRVMQASDWETLVRPPDQDPRAVGDIALPRLYHPELTAVAPQPGQPPKIDLPDRAARSELKIVWMGGSEAPAQPTSTGRIPGLASSPAVATATITTTGVVRQMVIENSASMAANNKLATLKEAVLQELDQSDIGDTVGIITFDGMVKVAQPLTVIDSQATRERIKASVRDISPGGKDAAIGDAARKALEGFTASNVPEDSIWAVYLIADGPSTTGIAPTSVITDYQEAYASLYTFGYGVNEEAAAPLQEMAEATEGQYRFVSNRADLAEAFNSAYEATLMAMAVDIKTGDGTASDEAPFTAPIFVDSTLGELMVDVYYEGATAPTLKLLDPQGLSGGAAECSVSEEEDFTGTVCSFTISEPISGTWQLQAETTGEDVDLFYWASGLMKDDMITYYAEVDTVDGESVVNPSEPVLLYATVEKEYPIMKAVISGSLELPNGDVQPFTLRDDGQEPDDKADDGVYAASLNLKEAGDYYVMVAFDNSAGTAMYSLASYAPFKKGKEPMPEPYLVGENFERLATTQLYVPGPVVRERRPPVEPGQTPSPE
jgi:uncharacterized protein YegL